MELAVRVARGDDEGARAAVDWLVQAAPAGGTAVGVVIAFTAAALAAKAPERACALLAELEQTPGAHESSYDPRELTAMVRIALAAGDPALATRLADGLVPHYPLDEHALCAARAQLAEHAGDHAQAARFYAEAAAGWQQFGNVPEHAYALLGQGRCLFGLGDSAAQELLVEARELFASMGYKPALAEIDTLLSTAVTAVP